MDVENTPDPARLASRFDLPGEVVAVDRWGHGRINDSFAVALDGGDATRRILLQRINDHVFGDPLAVMENVRRVTDHLRAKRSDEPDLDRRVLQLISTRDGPLHHIDERGGTWRAYVFIDGATSVPTIDSPERSHDVGIAYGRYLRDLADLPGPRLHETIPGFHDTPARLAALRTAVEEDRAGRVATSGAEIDAARSCAGNVNLLEDARRAGRLPERIVHDDAKLENILFDDATGRALCVTDLDTTMPGLSLHDIGDLVRSVAAIEEGAGTTSLRGDVVEAVLTGWLEATGDLLEPEERDLVPVAPAIIAHELGMRFLTDHLDGDVYFRTDRPGKNLRRARAQLGLATALAEHEEELRRIVTRR